MKIAIRLPVVICLLSASMRATPGDWVPMRGWDPRSSYSPGGLAPSPLRVGLYSDIFQDYGSVSTYQGKVDDETQDWWASALYVIDKIRSAKPWQVQDFFRSGPCGRPFIGFLCEHCCSFRDARIHAEVRRAWKGPKGSR